MIKINEKIETEKQSHNVGVKDASYEAVRALINDGWELVVLEPTKHKGYMRRDWVVWYARMVKGNHAIYIEVSGYAYGIIGAEYQCPICGDSCGDNDWCSNCDNDIEPVLVKSIPADFIGHLITDAGKGCGEIRRAGPLKEFCRRCQKKNNNTPKKEG